LAADLAAREIEASDRSARSQNRSRRRKARQLREPPRDELRATDPLTHEWREGNLRRVRLI
jgi:hypothetical protein